MNIKFLLPKARAFIEKGKIPKRASQRFRGLVPLQHMLPTDDYIDKVEKFTYLGSIITPDGGTAEDIETRIRKARTAFELRRN